MDVLIYSLIIHIHITYKYIIKYSSTFILVVSFYLLYVVYVKIFSMLKQDCLSWFNLDLIEPLWLSVDALTIDPKASEGSIYIFPSKNDKISFPGVGVGNTFTYVLGEFEEWWRIKRKKESVHVWVLRNRWSLEIAEFASIHFGILTSSRNLRISCSMLDKFDIFKTSV